VDDVRHEIGVLFLLQDLQMRLSRRDEALTLIRHAFQIATDKRQNVRKALDAAVSRGKATQQQIESMRSLVTWLNNIVLI
jgi:hypothetical protein